MWRITTILLVLLTATAAAQEDEPLPEPEEIAPEPVPEPVPELVPVPPPAPPRPRTPFDQGRMSLAFGLSTQSNFNQRYYVVAGGFGYFVLPGLEPSVHAVHWFGGDPGVTQVSPQLRYVVVAVPGSIKPYLGAFYTHWFVGDDLGDLDTVGARAGIVSYGHGSFVLGLGVAYERVISECVEDCYDVYPDLSLSLSL